MVDSYRKLEPIAMPGVHERFIEWFRERIPAGVKILDAGAGIGAMSQAVHRLGFDVAACDQDAEAFSYPPVEFREADITGQMPWPDESFDVCLAIEVTEHIHDHDSFFGECSRVLKPGGRLYVTTPNILSLKSRMRFLLYGYPYSFDPLDRERDDGLQHVASYTFDQYRYISHKHGLSMTALDVDKRQSTSIGMMFLWPLLMFAGAGKGRRFREHNRLKLLLGRVLFMEFTKERPDVTREEK